MSMLNWTRISLVALALSPTTALADGPKLFVAMQCNTCHAISVAGIAWNRKDSQASDLSKVGVTRDDKFISMYLLKKTDITGVKHKATFPGTTEDLRTMANWLASLK